MTKSEELAKLKDKAAEILKYPGTSLVFGEGSPDAKVMFIGEAPGFHEDRLGRPFVGPAGKLLDRLLESAGLRREDVYITNVLKNRPPGNRDPLPGEIKEAGPILDGQIEIVSPEVIVTLGRFSMGKFLPGAKISTVHGQPKRVGRFLIVPMYHPAAALRAGDVMTATLEDFRKLPEILESSAEIWGEGEDPNQQSLF